VRGLSLISFLRRPLMHKYLLILAILLLTGCYSIMNPFSRNILREVLAEPPPPGCKFNYTKLYADEPTSCYCLVKARTADGEIARITIEVDDSYCLKDNHETDQSLLPQSRKGSHSK
jgi:hypothetical protein